MESDLFTQKLVFSVTGKITHDLRRSVQELLLGLGRTRRWLKGSPLFLDYVDENSVTAPGDTPLETLGGYLDILPANSSSKEADIWTFEDVSCLVDSLREFSDRHAVEIEFELDGEYIGAIRSGALNRSLSEGLLGEWKRQLGWFDVKVTDDELLEIARNYVHEEHPDWEEDFYRLPYQTKEQPTYWIVTFTFPPAPLGVMCAGGVPIIYIDKASKKVIKAVHSQ